MRIQSLETSYFLGFGDNLKIDFDDAQVIGIVGAYEDSDEKSNRAGKSSLLEAILYNLYGKARSKNIINWNYKKESMYVECVYDFNGRVIRIRRGKNQSNESFLEVEGFEGEKKLVTQDELNKIIGCNYDDFIALNYFLQGDIHKFISSGSSAMGNMLGRWLNTDYWNKYKSATDTDIKRIESEITELKIFNRDNSITLDIIKSLIEEKKEFEEGIDALKGELNALKGTEAILKAYIQLTDDVDKETSRGKKLKTRSENISEKLDRARAKFKKIELDKKKAELLKSKISKKYTKKDSLELVKEIKSKEKRITILEKNISDWNSKIEELNQGRVFCPVTERECEYLDGSGKKKVLKEMNSEKTIFFSQLEEVKKELKSLELKKTKIDAILETNSDIELELAGLQTDVTEQNDEILELMKDQNDCKSDIIDCANRINKILKSIKKYDTKKIEKMTEELEKSEELEDEIERQVKVIGEYNLKIKSGNQNIKKLRENIKQIRVLEKKLKHLKFISFMFGKSGIPSNQIESAFDEVEADANYILKSKLKTDIQIEFRNYKELSDKETVCPACGFAYPKGYRKLECESCGVVRGYRRKDELSLKMFVNGNESDFDSDSGGGKVLVTVALRLALIRMLRRRVGISCSMLFFDEIFAMLDRPNRMNVMKLILETLNKDFEFEQIFCISHQLDVSETLKDNILVTKHDKYSDFQWC